MGPIAEWLARIEHKIDILLRAVAKPMHMTTPMEFSADPCPLCKEPVQYQLQHQLGYVLRRCGCKTGKIPSTIPLIPSGDTNGNSRSRNDAIAAAEPVPEDGSGSEAREPGSRRVRR